MSDLGRVTPDPPEENAKERLRTLATRQFGVVATRQLIHLGISYSVVCDWAKAGDLQRLHRGVYAVGHLALSTKARLTAAVLYAGPDAMLSHATAAWWLGLTNRRPSDIHVSTPRRCRSCQGIKVHGRRPLDWQWHNDVAIASIADVLIDYANEAGANDVRYVLAQAEYHGWLDLDTLKPKLDHGRPGSAALRRAIAYHEPQLARTFSELERRLVRLCERYRLPMPKMNVRREGYRVDAVWDEQKVVVELDGREGHASWARAKSDRRRDLALRAKGYIVLRYTWDQLTHDAGAVARDIATALARRS